MPAARYVVWMLAALAVASGARADEGDKAACMAAHGDAQVSRHENRLRAARADLEKCASSRCPALVADDCTRWLAEVEQQQPSIVVAASDPDGRAVVDATLEIDGKVAATKLDGTAVDIDPGEHELRVRSADGRSVAQRFVARESEKARLVRVQLPPLPGSPPPPHPPPPARARRRIPVAAWVLAGVAVASAIPWAVFGLLGWTQKSSLDSTCKGTCSPGSIDDVRRDFVVADVTGGAALVAVTCAVLVALLAPSPTRALSAAVTSGGSLMLFTQRF